MTQAQALSIMKTGVNVYLSGSAGSGKTYVLNQYIKWLYAHGIPVAVTASTGIAATHMNGMTIHGWSGIGIKDSMTPHDLDQLESKQYLWKRFEKARVLIIDEVSMLHSFRLDMVEKVCRRFKRSDKPFGGLQVILSGDFFQLPPINRAGDSSVKDMVMHSQSWELMQPAICYLTEQHRQEDDALTEILNMIRLNTVEEKHFLQLEERLNAKLPDTIEPTRLYTHNSDVDAENMAELAKIDSLAHTYTMTATGSPVLVEILKKSCLAHESLSLKVGAEVMCVKNNFEEGYVNGSRGVVIDFRATDNMPIVELYNGKQFTFTPETWAIEEDGKTKASISQIPLRLAWAITIHKSQGMSLDVAEIDLSKSFAFGMGYVALSRVRTLHGIKLVGFNADALRVDPQVLEFDQELRNESTLNEQMFGKLKKAQQEKMETDFILRMGGTVEPRGSAGYKPKPAKPEKEPTIMITKKHLEEKKSIKDICKTRGLTAGTITHHIEQILAECPDLDISHIKPKQKHIDLVAKASAKLTGEDIGKLSPIKTILEKEGHKLSFEEIRLARLFI